MSSHDLRVVLIHGLWDDPKVFNRLITCLAQKNVLVFAPYLPHRGGRTSLRDCAVELNKLILERFGVNQQINLLGFSMGGLISRVWLQKMGGAVRTNSFISVGSPHLGTLTAQLVPSFVLSGVADMKCGSNLLRELNKDISLLNGVRCTSYYCQWDLMVFPSWHAVLPIGSSHSVPVLTHKGLITQPKSLEILTNAIFSNC